MWGKGELEFACQQLAADYHYDYRAYMHKHSNTNCTGNGCKQKREQERYLSEEEVMELAREHWERSRKATPGRMQLACLPHSNRLNH